MGYGLRAAGCGLRAMGYGRCAACRSVKTRSRLSSQKSLAGGGMGTQNGVLAQF